MVITVNTLMQGFYASRKPEIFTEKCGTGISQGEVREIVYKTWMTAAFTSSSLITV